MKGRFDKLKSMYKGGMQYVGWRKYDALKLEYDTKSKGKNGKELYLIYGVKEEG